MHENREISNTPSSVSGGRSEKAINHNADMHVMEKSHRAVVPVSHPNKAVQAAAEDGEGRARMKENIAQFNMQPTQSGNRMSLGLAGVRKAARERKQERFTSLLHHLSVDLFCATASTLSSVRLRRESMVCDGRSMKAALKIGLSIFTAGFIVERTGRNLQGESIYRSWMGGSAQSASRLWRTKYSNRRR
jgi:hypothetical protein